jgi:hypothetical protein
MSLKSIKIVPEQIVAIKIYDRSKSNVYRWEKEWKLFNRFFHKKEGFYDTYDGDLYTEEAIVKSGLLVEDKVVYNKPYLKFIMINKDTFIKEFDTMNELNSFMKSCDIEDLLIEL